MTNQLRATDRTMKTQPPIAPVDEPNTEVLIERINSAMDKQALNAKSLSIKAGIANTYVSDLLARRSRAPGLFPIIKIAHALDVTVAYLIGEDEDARTPTLGLLDQLPLIGTAEAGAFRVLPTEHKAFKRMPGQRHPNYPEAEHFYVEVNDLTMDGCTDMPLVPGMHVSCIDIVSARLPVETGRLYLIQRGDGHGKYERVIRRAYVHTDNTIFRAESASLPSNAEEIADIVVKTPAPVEDGLFPTGRGGRVAVLGWVYSGTKVF